MPPGHQLYLSCFRPDERPTILDPGITARVQACRTTLQALHLHSGRIAFILSQPDRHWRRITRIMNGKRRVCFQPDKELSAILTRIVQWLSRNWNVQSIASSVATAFGEGCSIIKNARWHRHSKSSFCVDLKDAFQSIRTKHVMRWLIHCCFSRDLAWVVSHLITYRGRLRQGAPSSPVLFNLLMGRFDEEVCRTLPAPIGSVRASRGRKLYCRMVPQDGCYMASGNRGIIYTRYGDDLCFSSLEEIFPAGAKAAIFALIKAHHLEINPRKIREGRSGVIEFPGVVIVRGRIRPQTRYLRCLSKVVQFRGLSHLERQGHQGFLNQFGREGNLSIVPRLLAR